MRKKKILLDVGVGPPKNIPYRERDSLMSKVQVKTRNQLVHLTMKMYMMKRSKMRKMRKKYHSSIQLGHPLN